MSGARKRGSENNDPFCLLEGGKIATSKNDSGGVLGGITNGKPVVVRAVRDAMEGGGVLSERELLAWSERDLAAGRRCVAPLDGTVVGISPHDSGGQ